MVKKLVHRTPVPWIHQTNPLVTTWTWETSHFKALIIAEGLPAGKKMFSWKITDKTSGHPTPFDSSTAKDYRDAAEQVLEAIGKGYERILGYGDYAGELTTTFAVYDGRKVNLGPLIGEQVTLRVHDVSTPNNDMLITGQFDVQHHDICIYDGNGNATYVPPSYLKSIRREFSPAEAIEELWQEQQGRSPGMRVFHTEWRKGCTGKAGFREGTTEHSTNDPFCPIHNI